MTTMNFLWRLAATGTLYIQVLSLILIMSILPLAFNPIALRHGWGCFSMMLIAMFTRGCCRHGAGHQTVAHPLYSDLTTMYQRFE